MPLYHPPYSRVAEVERLRQQVVTDIRSNQQLEADLNQMDIKIGLLVRNRITLQVSSASWSRIMVTYGRGSWSHVVMVTCGHGHAPRSQLQQLLDPKQTPTQYTFFHYFMQSSH